MRRLLYFLQLAFLLYFAMCHNKNNNNINNNFSTSRPWCSRWKCHLLVKAAARDPRQESAFVPPSIYHAVYSTTLYEVDSTQPNNILKNHIKKELINVSNMSINYRTTNNSAYTTLSALNFWKIRGEIIFSSLQFVLFL